MFLGIKRKSSYGIIEVWNETKGCFWFHINDGEITGTSFSPSGEYLLVATDRMHALFDIKNALLSGEIIRYPSWIKRGGAWRCVFSPDGKFVVFGTFGRVVVYDIYGEDIAEAYPNSSSGPPVGVNFVRDGSRIVTYSDIFVKILAVEVIYHSDQRMVFCLRENYIMYHQSSIKSFAINLKHMKIDSVSAPVNSPTE